MSYTPTVWQTGDVVSATKLNKIEAELVALDSGTGVSEALKTALLQLASKVAYIDDQGQDYYQDLYDALYPGVTYAITNTLTGCSNSNAAATVAEGSSYSGTITADAGYSLTGATVSVTMGGTDVTASAYNNGTISIASVTGNIVITVTAVAVTLSSISAVYTQSGTVYDTDSLNSLKADLIVTATYSDSSTQTVPSADYTLSGTLTVGTSTITVTYSGKTTTFTVTVTDYRTVMSYSYANGDMAKKNCTVINNNTYKFCLNVASNYANTRRTFNISRGTAPFYETTSSSGEATVSDPPLYPIPVPPTATKVTVAITPNSQYFGISGLTLSDGKYTMSLDDGWKQGSRTITFAAETYTHIALNCKYNSGGSAYVDEPTDMTVTFE